MEKLTYLSPHCTLTNDQIIDLFKDGINEAYKFHLVNSEEAQNISIKSKFGGKPYNEGEIWPICTKCQNPLQFIFQFNSDNLQSNKKIDSNCLFVFFMCMDEDGGCCPGNGHDDGQGTWLIRRYTNPSIEKSKNIDISNQPITPYNIEVEYVRNMPDQLSSDTSFLPELLKAIAVNEEDETLFNLYEEIAVKLLDCKVGISAGSKYLGTPHIYNPFKIPACELCDNKPMDLLFQIGYQRKEDIIFMFGDCGYIYLFYCQNHQDNIKFRALY